LGYCFGTWTARGLNPFTAFLSLPTVYPQSELLRLDFSCSRLAAGRDQVETLAVSADGML